MEIKKGSEKNIEPGKKNSNDDLIILTVISNYFSGTRVQTIASWYKVVDIKTHIGLGTVKRAVSKNSSAIDMRKEVILILCTEVDSEGMIKDLITEMHIDEPNSGIAFTIRNGDLKYNLTPDQISDELFYAVAITVNEGFAEDVILESIKADIKGATIIPSYSYSHPFAKGEYKEILKANSFVEEKETVLLITSGFKAKAIFKEIHANHDILTNGKGVMFISKVERTVGITYY